MRVRWQSTAEHVIFDPVAVSIVPLTFRLNRLANVPVAVWKASMVVAVAFKNRAFVELTVYPVGRISLEVEVENKNPVVDVTFVP